MKINNLYEIRVKDSNGERKKYVAAPSIKELLEFFSYSIVLQNNEILAVNLISDELLNINIDEKENKER